MPFDPLKLEEYKKTLTLEPIESKLSGFNPAKLESYRRRFKPTSEVSLPEALRFSRQARREVEAVIPKVIVKSIIRGIERLPAEERISREEYTKRYGLEAAAYVFPFGEEEKVISQPQKIAGESFSALLGIPRVTPLRASPLYQDPEVQEFLKKHPVGTTIGEFGGRIASLIVLNKATAGLFSGLKFAKLPIATARRYWTAIHRGSLWGMQTAIEEGSKLMAKEKPAQEAAKDVLWNTGVGYLLGYAHGFPRGWERMASAGGFAAATSLLKTGSPMQATLSGAMWATLEGLWTPGTNRQYKLQNISRLDAMMKDYLRQTDTKIRTVLTENKISIPVADRFADYQVRKLAESWNYFRRELDKFVDKPEIKVKDFDKIVDTFRTKAPLSLQEDMNQFTVAVKKWQAERSPAAEKAKYEAWLKEKVPTIRPELEIPLHPAPVTPITPEIPITPIPPPIVPPVAPQVAKMPIPEVLAKVPTPPVEEVKPIPRELEPLAAEARKYKSAEEFVKAKATLMRGAKTAEIRPGEVGVYLTPDRAMAETFAGKEGIITKAFADVKKTYRIPKADEYEWLDALIENPRNYSKYIAELKSKGYDSILSSDKKQLLVFDKSKVLTEKQLTDFYTQATKEIPEVKPAELLKKIVGKSIPKEILTDDDIDRIMFEKGVEDYMKGEVGEGNIYSIIKSEGGIAPYKKGLPGALREEYREDVPIILRNKKGLPLDEMADILKNRYPYLGIETESDLLEALGKEKLVHLYTGIPLGPELKFPNLGIMNKLASKFDVEAPFKKLGKPETGIALKTFFAKVETEQGKGLEVIKGLNKLKLSNKEYQNLPFLVYQPGRFVILSEADRKRMSPGYQIVRGYFKQAEAELKEAEIISEGFPQSMVKRLQEENIQLRALFKKKISFERMTKIKQQIEDNQKTIDFIKKARIQYVPIPLRLWFKDLLETSPQKIPHLISQYFKTREIVDLKGFAEYLLEEGIITPEDLDIRRIIGSYAHQKGLKLGMAKIINTAIKEGLLKPIDQAPEGWQSLPSRIAPGLKGYKGHPAFIDYLEDNFIRHKGGLAPEISRPLAYIKMMQFYNPFFLSIYDLYQGAWLGSVRDIKTPEYFVKAINSIKNKDAAYWQAMEKGLFSQPFVAPWDEYMRNVEREVASLSDPLKKAWQDLTGRLEKQKIFGAVDALYRSSWTIAWTGDKTIRLVSYYYMLDKGFTPEEAAQIAAKMHGDYASVPPSSKAIMNKIFFTPTFQIVMTKVQFEMAQRTGYLLAGSKDKTDRKFAQALLALVALIIARKMLFKKWGFEEESFGYRYKKTITTPEGEEKELIISVPTPDNILMRYWHRLKRIPETDDKLEKILLAVPFTLHPLWDYGRVMIGNKQPGGIPVYNVFDNPDKITKDIFIYTLNRLVRVTETIKELRREERTAGIKAMEQDLGSIAKVLRWFAFPYLRNPKIQRQSYKIFRLQQEFKRLLRIDPPKTPEEEEIRLNNFQKMLEEMHKKLDESGID